MTLLLAGSGARFDSLTEGRAPSWSGAVAFPASNTIVIKLKGDPARALRHELAHLALHAAVSQVPRWFDEGYAAWAAGEWDRLDVLRVNWELARGAPPTLDQLNRDLQGATARAEAAYALSASAVQLLARIGGDRGLEPLVTALRHASSFDAALREAHAVTLDQFEELWHRDLRRRYGWLSFLTSATVLWGWLAVLLVMVWAWRRRRDRARRLALDEGWEIPPDEPPPTS
jgi:MYXO-CTERM domain-containing protein